QVKGSFVEAAKSADPTERSYDPKTLIRKVESEVLGHTSVDSGEIVVDADPEGVVTLRGQVGSQRLIDELVEQTRNVEGVKDVHNLLHLPNESPPNTPVAADAGGNGRA
ncbi:MAG: BON domain-containing protein, partial [Nitriliruptorales bacterium]|nr:BON domain-containing protein [Nitriliruptorales bacterium]